STQQKFDLFNKAALWHNFAVKHRDTGNSFLRARSIVDDFKKNTVFGILLFIDYSPLRCQKEQDSPQPRTRKC
ncbi:hypothetical protein I8U93_006369, partial [Klebsiella oxytoca]